MFTKSDKKFLKENFATKDDLQSLETRIGETITKKLKPIKSSLRQINKSLDTAIDTFDRQIVYHHKRLVSLDQLSSHSLFNVQ